jgi:hypothetical protein
LDQNSSSKINYTTISKRREYSITMKITWYISSPRAESCSSVLAAVNKALKAYTHQKQKNMSEIELEGKDLYQQVLVRKKEL